MDTRAELARAMFHYVQAFYNPLRRQSTLGYLSPIDCEDRPRQTRSSPKRHFTTRPAGIEEDRPERRGPKPA